MMRWDFGVSLSHICPMLQFLLPAQMTVGHKEGLLERRRPTERQFLSQEWRKLEEGLQAFKRRHSSELELVLRKASSRGSLSSATESGGVSGSWDGS